MAKSKPKVRDYFEPWTAKPSTAWESGFRFPPEGADPDVRERWDAEKAHAAKHADWLVWGSRMTQPSFAQNWQGEAVVMDGTHIVAKVRKIVTDHDNPPSLGEVAERIAQCVSACQGIADPADVVERTRALLFDLADGTADASDPRVIALLARIVPPGAQKPGNDE